MCIGPSVCHTVLNIPIIAYVHICAAQNQLAFFSFRSVARTTFHVSSFVCWVLLPMYCLLIPPPLFVCTSLPCFWQCSDRCPLDQNYRARLLVFHTRFCRILPIRTLKLYTSCLFLFPPDVGQETLVAIHLFVYLTSALLSFCSLPDYHSIACCRKAGGGGLPYRSLTHIPLGFTYVLPGFGFVWPRRLCFFSVPSAWF